ncbi:hypothetical protein BD410DRAFT_899240 [Rickenella mellea]|uniref:Transmembrane protein n=1 Tax=Rickenella mellea TaxID=50990 RepID=A0A4Y7Q0P0_9AGAM|nr:hypothetical protein BD410DRAFT_899240 [Rickenella mellea]
MTLFRLVLVCYSILPQATFALVYPGHQNHGTRHAISLHASYASEIHQVPPAVEPIRPRRISRHLPRAKHVKQVGDSLDPFGFIGGSDEPAQDQPTLITDGLPTSSSKTRHASTLTSTSISTTLLPTIASTGGSDDSLSTTAQPTQDATTTGTSTPSSLPVEPTDAPSNPSNDQTALSHWKIVGGAVIAFTAVTAVILGVTFFDQWWTDFLRPIVWKRKRTSHMEELIPDWDKRSWRIGIEEKDDRYPTVGSFPSILRMQGMGGGERDEYGSVAVLQPGTTTLLPPFPPRGGGGVTTLERSTSTSASSTFRAATANEYQQPGIAGVGAGVQLPIPTYMKGAVAAAVPVEMRSPEVACEEAYGGVEPYTANPFVDAVHNNPYLH